ncbi:MAG: mechanosensitive ion channel family protein [Promethearchaeota archaeon]
MSRLINFLKPEFDLEDMFPIENLLYNEYFQFFLVLLGALIIAMLFHSFLKNYVKKKMPEKPFYEALLNSIMKQVYIVIILASGYFIVKSFLVQDPYVLWLDIIAYVLIILIIALLFSRILTILIRHWLKVQKKFEAIPDIINRIVSITVYLIALLIILSHFNIEITPFIATLGIASLAVGLALQNTLSNFFAGLHLISDRPIKIGDFIELEGNISGYVVDIGWRSTRIRTLLNTIIIVPNSKLVENLIINYALPVPAMLITVECGVAYGSNLKKVEDVTLEIARWIQKTAPGAVRDFDPLIRYHSFGDSNINFRVFLKIDSFGARAYIIHEFIKELKERYDTEGIEISWPVRKIYHGD